MHVSFVAGAMLFIDHDVLAQLAAALPSSETVERRAGPNPATHGGQISLVFAAFLFFTLASLTSSTLETSFLLILAAGLAKSAFLLLYFPLVPQSYLSE